nr:hypothetical protein [Tanacetum cinerariifolium]
TIKEEVYVCQPPGFEDLDYPDKVYKVVKALYGLHQAPIPWYETLANYLLENGFHKGQIDQTLFIKKQQVKQKQDGIFISQDKYVAKILRKFGLTDRKSASTPIDTEKPLLKDPNGKDADVHTYRSMIGSLMYLILSRPDIMFVVCACARFQVTPKASQLHAVKMIFSDYTCVSLDRKSTTGGCQFSGYASKGFEQILDFLNASLIQYALTVNLTIYVSCIKQFWSSVSIKKMNDVVRLQALIDRRKVIISEDIVRQASHLDDAESIDCFPNEEIFAELARLGYEKPCTKLTFYKAFFSAQWKFLIHTILQCMSVKRTAWNEFSSSMALAVICIAICRKFNFSKYIFDSLVRNVDSFSKFFMVGKGLFGVNTPLFEGILVPQQAADDVANVDVEDVVAEDTAEPTPPSPDTVMDDCTRLKIHLFGRSWLIKIHYMKHEDDSKQGEIAEIDADEDVTLEEVAAEVTKDVEV